ncbi:MAG: hydroxymethylbilane synthase [Pseudomonadota bacterium]
MTTTTPLRIGTRGSPLALVQSEMVRRRLVDLRPEHGPEPAIDVVVIKTSGDLVLDRSLAEAGGKGLFTKEIDEALLAGRIDMAVHSLKDVPTWLPEGIVLAAVLEREDPRDAFISFKAKQLFELPAGAVVGTASLRRQAQILQRRPDLKVTLFRGNVETRLRKLHEGAVDATLLALAGLRRLGRADAATAILEPDEMLPAPGQGVIAIACRADDGALRERLQSLDHAPTRIEATAERALLEALDGSCRTPIAALARADGDRLTMKGLVAKPDGSRVVSGAREGAGTDAAALGRALGLTLRAEAGPGFLPGF